MLTEPAPYCPDTLAAIRSMARIHSVCEIAAALRWDIARLQRVAAEQSIDLPRAAHVDLIPEQPLPVVVTPRTVEFILGHGIRWSPRSSQLQRRSVVLVLPDLQGLIFGVLFADYCEGKDAFTSRKAVCQRVAYDGAAENISGAIPGLMRRTAPLGIFIESKMGVGGGYRLMVAP